MKIKKHLTIPILIATIIVITGLTIYIPYKSSYNPELEGLTEIQVKVYEDYEYFWNFMNENFALWGMMERNGFDRQATYEEYKKQIVNCNAYEDFYNIILFPLSNEFNQHNAKHTNVISDDFYQYLYYLYSERNEASKKEREANHSEQEIEKALPIDEYFFDLLNGAKEFYNEAEYTPNATPPIYLPLRFKIIELNEIAYINLPQMNYNEYDKERLVDFLNEIKSYPNLIIDIRGNGGGSTSTIVPFFQYLSDEAFNYDVNLLLAGSDYNKEYLELSLPNDCIFPIEKEKFSETIGEKLNVDDLAYVDSYIKITKGFPVAQDLYTGFTGDIYLLVDDNVFSSAETFAYVCKVSGFATLVGKTNTRGDGLGSTPNIFMLHNSNILWRYTESYGLNPDGSNNAEFGTSPDILVPEDEDELEYCLDLIEQSK